MNIAKQILNQGPRMDCRYMIKVPPIIKTVDNTDYWMINDYYNWLRRNNITRFRGGHWPRGEEYTGSPIVFRFADEEDAMAFKLAWI